MKFSPTTELASRAILAWLDKRPFSKESRARRGAERQQRRARKKRLKELGITEDTTTMKYLKSRTIQGILASGVAAVLGLIMGDADAATLAPKVFEWLLSGVQLGGLLWAARGRKLAAGPLCPPALVVAALLVALLVMSSTASAEEKTLTWTPPTEYTDGSPLDPLEELERYELGCGPAAGVRDGEVRSWIATPSATRVEDFDVGEWHCALRVRAITTAEQRGEWSDWSGEVNFTVAPPVMAPAAPTNLEIS